MRRVTRNGVIAVAAASGAMAVTIPAYAASSADGSTAGSPGQISGNTVQLPAQVPANVCGNTVNVAGLLNPAAGTTCANEGRSVAQAGTPDGAAAESSGTDSSGVVSGNGVRLPVHLPVNVTGNTVNVVGVGNAATGNESVNTPGDRPDSPNRPTSPAPQPPVPPRAHPEPNQPIPHAPAPTTASLARTGADHTLPAVAGSAALVLVGAALHRRFRSRSEN